MYTYAFFRNSAARLEMPEGIAGSLQVVSTAQLSALVEPGLLLEDLQNDDDRLVQAVLSHDRVIRRVFQQTTILPLRFGTRFRSLENLLDHLKEQEPSYLKILTQFEGKAEYTLKLIPVELPESPIAAESKGKDYFLAKKKQYQAQQERQNQQQLQLQQVMEVVRTMQAAELISQINVPSVTDRSPADGKIYLFSRCESEAKLYQYFQVLQQRCPQLQIIVEGPLPPYHFLE